MANENMKREACIRRRTSETNIDLKLRLDGAGNYNIETGVPFFNHMLEQLAKHGSFDLELEAVGDTHIDCHHIIEDTGIVLGKAFRGSVGEGAGIERYGSALIPMDESLCSAAADICGRPRLVFNAGFPAVKAGDMDTELVEEFFHAFCSNAFVTLHINMLYGKNTHHMIECIFKSAAHALRQAVKLKENTEGVLSTKGSLI
ncbi:MAG: imidazoleglycerol-phosphate dehydratase HisB [Bacillota bacterium]